MPRPIAHFALQPADVLTLQGWLRMSTLEQSLAQRARILLLLNEGVTPIAIISHSHGSGQLAVSVFDVRLEDFGPELQAADPGTKKLKEVTERIGKTPPAGLKRRATK